MRGRPVICGGDWNCVINAADRRVGRPDGSTRPAGLDPNKDHRKPDARTLREHLDELGLVDVLEAIGRLPTLEDMTHHQRSNAVEAVHTSSRLDRIYISGELVPCASSLKALPTDLSDHLWVVAHLDFGVLTRAPGEQEGRGLWRLNPELLRHQWILDLVNIIIDQYLDALPAVQEAGHPRGMDVCAWYEKLLKALVEQLKLCSRVLRARRGLKLQEAQEGVITATARLHRQPDDAEALEQLLQAQRALAAEEERRLKEARERAKKRWFGDGERPNRAFYRVVQARQRARTVIGELVEARDGSLAARLAATEKFYRELYSHRDIDEQAVARLLSACEHSLSPGSQADLDEPLLEPELRAAVKSMAKGKAAGCDGLPVELFSACPGMVTALTEMWQGALRAGSLPPTARTGAISLLFKKGERNTLKNYRPITLLTSSYKVIAKAMSRRLANVVRQVVGPEQTGFIPGRDIRSNITETQLAFRLAKASGLHGAICFYDFEKAYDRLSREYLWQVLRRLGFGDAFIHAVQVLNADACALVVFNGHRTARFRLESGVRQGCPLSPLLFAIATEPLRASITRSPEPGLIVRGISVRVSLYADDMSTFAGSQAAFNDFHGAVECFERAAAMAINVGKSRALIISSPPDGTPPLCVAPLAIMQEEDLERVLGSLMGHKANQLDVLAAAEEAIEKKIKHYSRFGLTIFGRVLLANSCLLSHLWFLSSFAIPPIKRMLAIRSSCRRFVLGGSPGCRHESTLRLEASKPVGGLGLLNPIVEAQAIRAMLLVRLLVAEEDAPWRHLLWAALVDVAQLDNTVDVVGHNFSEKVFPDPSGRPVKDKAGYVSFETEVLRDFSRLQPVRCPTVARATFDYCGKQKRWVARCPELPSAHDLEQVRLAGNKTLKELTVKLAYRFLLERACRTDPGVVKRTRDPAFKEWSPLSPVPAHPTPQCREVKMWVLRWRWLRKVRIPNSYRQLIWRRWHSRLYLGETKDDPTPLCPLCPEEDEVVDSVHHFGKECKRLIDLRGLLQEWWRFWFGEAFSGRWWADEFSEDPRWMILFAVALHALYSFRYKVVRGDCQPTRIHFVQAFKLDLCATLDLVAEQPGPLNADGVWFEEVQPASESSTTKLKAIIRFP